MKHFLILLKSSIWLILWLGLGACSSDDAIETNSLTFNFIVKTDEERLVFDTKKYLTSSNQQIIIERIQFYLSNIQVRDAETNEVFSEADSYHLISFDAASGTGSFTVEHVPAAYQISEISMAIGVDSEANTSIDHVGDLDPTNGMAWDWNTGYKFLLMEGRYFPENDPIGQEIKMHIGTDKNYFPMSISFGEPLSVAGNLTLVYTVDALAPFGNIDLSEGTVFMNDERGDAVAQNYKGQLIQLEESFGFVK